MLKQSILGVICTASLFILSACTQQEEPTTADIASEPTSVLEQAQADIEPGSPPESHPPMPAVGSKPINPNQRAINRAERMALSEATEFNMNPLLDPNTATEAALSSVDGLSAESVQAILDGRPFATASELHAAIGDGMSEEDMFNVYSAVFVKVNLNRGNSEDFKLVPTTLTPDHIAREFVEYRPYGDLNDFSPEMKKYVSAKEVAFLERFVIID